MDVPLGYAAGNALEVRTALDVLSGGGPGDVVELTLLLAEEMLNAAGTRTKDPAQALHDGSAMRVWRQMVQAQGGDPDAPLPVALHQHEIRAAASGVLTHLDAIGVGVAAWRLGAGRARQGEPVQAGAGVEWFARPGGAVVAGQRLFVLHTDTPERIPAACEALDGAYGIGAQARPRLPLIVDRIT
jgi:thymidine phosphorylase